MLNSISYIRFYNTLSHCAQWFLAAKKYFCWRLHRLCRNILISQLQVKSHFCRVKINLLLLNDGDCAGAESLSLPGCGLSPRPSCLRTRGHGQSMSRKRQNQNISRVNFHSAIAAWRQYRLSQCLRSSLPGSGSGVTINQSHISLFMSQFIKYNISETTYLK